MPASKTSPPPIHRQPAPGGWRPALPLLLAVVLGSAGCSRQHWHERADDVAYSIVAERYTDPLWANPRTDVIADPRSRFYDPTDLDCAPLPPDDDAAHAYMHRVWGIKGYAHWHKFGDLDAVESPNWLDDWGLSSQTVSENFQHNGMYPELQDLSLGEAIELSYLHSRDYQTQVENVFLTALALSFERFRFQVQFVGLTATTPIGISNGNKPGFTSTGSDVPSVNDSVAFGPAAGVTQLTPWGSQWLVGLANNTLWFWADGKATDATTSTLSFSLIQPLLAGAGKRVVLENLTQAERNMLYAVRDFARYRMGFFTQIVGGGQIAGVTGTGQVGVGTGVSPLGSPTLTGGYLGLIQQAQIIANQEFNIRLLLSNLDKTSNRVSQPRRPYEVIDELPPGVQIPDDLMGVVMYRREPLLDEANRPIRNDDNEIETEGRLYIIDRLTDEQRDRLAELSVDPRWVAVIRSLVEKAGQATRNQQVAQLETQLASLYNQVRQNRTTLQNNIDQYKLTLGLPTSLPVTISRELLKPFQLVDPRLTRLVDRLESFVPDPPLDAEQHPDAAAMLRVNQLMQRYNPESPDQEILQGLVLEMFELRNDLVRDAIEPLNANYEAVLVHLAQRQTSVTPDPGLETLESYNQSRFRELRDRQVVQFELIEAGLLNLRKKVLERNLSLEARKAIAGEINDLREDMIALTQGVTATEANLRMELIDLNPFDLNMEEAVELGLQNRLDLKNVLAQVMDARRKVEVAANQLQAVLNITAAGDIRTQPLGSGNDNPFAFRGDESNIRLGIQFTTPIQLIQQRNTYRAALIGYQQARRNYMRVEDQVKLDCRTSWRNIDLFRRNFETAKANIRAAVIQYDIAVDQSNAPGGVTGGGAAGGAGGGIGGGGAGGGNQGLNILNALQSLLNAQNQLIQTWVSYEQNRLNIHNFMGILKLDDAGFWTDEFYQQQVPPYGVGSSYVTRSGVEPAPAAGKAPIYYNNKTLDLNLPPLPNEDLNNAGPQPNNPGSPPPDARRKPGREKRIQYARLETPTGVGPDSLDSIVAVRGSSPEADRVPGRAGLGRGRTGRLELRLHGQPAGD